MFIAHFLQRDMQVLVQAITQIEEILVGLRRQGLTGSDNFFQMSEQTHRQQALVNKFKTETYFQNM